MAELFAETVVDNIAFKVLKYDNIYIYMVQARGPPPPPPPVGAGGDLFSYLTLR